MAGRQADPLISLREAARFLGVHHSTLSRAAKRGQIAPAGSTPGGWARFRLSDVRKLKDAGVTGSADVSAPHHALSESTPVISEPDGALSQLPEIARRLVGADYAAVTVMDAAGRVDRMYYSGVSHEQAAKIGPLPTGRGVLGMLGPEDAPLRLDDISHHPRSVGFPAGHPPMESLLGVKVTGAAVKANLYVANGPGRSGFTPRDEELVKALTSYARVALLNEELGARESALRQASEQTQQQLQAVLERSPAAVIVIDAATRNITSVNATTEKILGIRIEPGASAERGGLPVKFTQPDGVAVIEENLPTLKALTTGQPTEPAELIALLPGGRQLPVLLSASPIHGPNGQVTAVVVVFQDVTRMKELERVKSDFFSMVTHDLRSPVATIKGIARTAITEVEAGSSIATYLDAIDEEADHLSEIVSNSLDMSRIEAGVNIFEMETCHMADLVHDAVRRMGRSRQAIGREITVEVPQALPSLYADPQQVGRVLDNLLSNALKYSGGPVRIRAFHDGQSRLVTEVIDHGDGIPPEHMDSLFSKFFRVRQGQRRGREGSGLGLAICRAVVEGQRGEIGVRSRLHEGSTFWFALPIEVRDAGS